MPKPEFEVRNPKIEDTLRKIGDMITNAVADATQPGGRRWGFALFLFEFGEDGSMFYISNGDRVDVQSMLMEYLTHRQTTDQPPS